MAKPLEEAEIQTRTARRRLAPGLYWRAVDTGVHLGYRRAAASGGVWLVRWRHQAGYRREALGDADDEIATGTLSFEAAVRKARETVERVRREVDAEAAGPVATIATAVDEYVLWRDARDSRRAGRSVRSDAARRLTKYVTGREAAGGRKAVEPSILAKIKLSKLAERDLLDWRDSLPGEIKTTTRQRLFNDFKAALNAAYVARRDSLPPTLPSAIKHGLRSIEDDSFDAEPVARENQILTDGQVAQLVAAAKVVDDEQGADGDLYRVVLILAATGARFSQITRMKVGDVQRDKKRLMVPASRKGKGAKGFADPVPVGEDVLDALAPIVEGRPAEAVLLERWRSVQVSGGMWEPSERGPWRDSSEFRRAWALIRERAEMPGVIPYALRHSSIVRGIRANLPLRLVAALHDTSTAMIERHYAKFITTGLEEMARAAIVPLTGGADG